MLTDKELEEIRRKMLELEEEPPMGGWAGIQAEVQPKKNWRPLWWLLSLLLILLTGLGTYHIHIKTPLLGEVAEKQVSGTGATPLAEQVSTSDIQMPAAVTLKPAPRAEAITPIVREHTAPERQSTQADRLVKVKTKVTAAEMTERVVPGVAYEKKEPEIPYIVLLPNRETEIEASANSTDAHISSRHSHIILPVWVAPSRAEYKVPIETKKGENAIETTTTPALSAAETTVTENLKQDVTPQVIPAVTGEKTNKKDKKPAVVEKRIPSRNEWTAGVYFAPRYAFRKFIPNANDDILITGVRNVNQLDPKRMGYEFGANFSRVIAPNLFVEAGLSWMQLKENVTYTLTTGQIDTFNVKQSNSGQIVVESKLVSEERQLISSYAYGGLRLGVTQYFLERGNRRYNVTVAGGANLLIKGETKQFSNGEWTETVVFPSKENILEQSNYNLQVGVGYNVSVLQKYELMLMPTMSYFLGSTFKEREPLGLRPYSLGVHFQLKRRFNL